LIDGLQVGQVVHLLEHQDPQDGSQLLGGAAETGAEAGGQFRHW